MKTGTKLIGIAGSFLLLCTFTIKQTNYINKVEWLIGTWENKTSKGSIYETWSKITDNELLGKSYIVKGKDTIVFENVRLVQQQDELFYSPTVKDQNNGLPVRFAAKIISATQLVFENAHHDFPQIISYIKISTDSLVAEISGVSNGKERKQTFPMKRIK
ncbi:DUF6265 family protein [Xanthocytophaga agilis]|uniref:DUF6265 family protein n=1 Tax=Xanthocytophaga agilis TaxID=3048010 RepID=A0AAE3RB53_9BACT|nr:DUF6265 family protein [Xanthocytophaga agilis]MDJ1506615.1 DUF6265 family protein [Xanthocytophaga agilis]